MGTWGDKSFESDDALERYGEVAEDLIARIDDVILDQEIWIDDVWGVVALVEVLAVLEEHCAPTGVEREKVEQWRERFLTAYDAQIESLEPQPGFAESRRKVIVATFDRLLKDAKEEQ